MKKTTKALLFALAVLTLVMMTIICVSAAANGDTASVDGFNEADYNFKVTEANGENARYFIDLGSTTKGTAGGAWTAVPAGGIITQLKDVTYPAGTNIYLYNANSFTFDGDGHTLTRVSLNIYNNESGDAAQNVITIKNVTASGYGICPFVICTPESNIVFEKVIATGTGSYCMALRAKNAKLTFNSGCDFQNFGTDSGKHPVFRIEHPVNLNFEAGTYKVHGQSNLFQIELTGANIGLTTQEIKNENAWDVVIKVNGGAFEHVHASTSVYYGSIFGFYNTTAKCQVEINNGTFKGNGTSLFTLFPRDVVDLDINGGTFDLSSLGDAQAIIFFPNHGDKSAPQMVGGENVMTSINVTGGTFYMRRTSMPVIYAYDNYNVDYPNFPVSITWNGAATLAAHGRLMVLRLGGIYDVLIRGDIGFESASSYIVESEERTVVNVTFDSCTVLKCAGLAMATDKGDENKKSTLHVTVTGGSYVSADLLLNVKYATAYSASLQGNFTIATANGFANDYTNVQINEVSTLSIAFVDKNTSFDNIPTFFKTKGVSVTYNFVVDKDLSIDNISKTELDTRSRAELDDLIEKGGKDFPDFVEIVGYSFQVKSGATLTLNNGTYEDITAEHFITIYDGVVRATGVTLSNVRGNIFRVVTPEKATDTARIYLDNCTINVFGGSVLYAAGGTDVEIQVTNGSELTTKESHHVFRSGTKTKNFVVYLENVTCTSGFNIVSFAPSDSARIEFINATINTPNSYAVYGGSWATYIFREGTYNCLYQLLYFAPQNDRPADQEPFKFHGLTFSGNGLFRLESADNTSLAAVSLDVQGVYAPSITHSAFVVIPGSTLELSIKNSIFIVTSSAAFINATNTIGDARDVSFSMIGVHILFNSNKGVLYKESAVNAYTPKVMFSGKSYYLYLSTGATYECERSAQLYISGALGTSGIRFVTTLSADLIELAKKGTNVSYGTLIAPTEYVVKAHEFTPEAIDGAMGSTNGVKDGLNTYIKVDADNSLRDRDDDGVYESFSAVLWNLKDTNYGRSFSAVAYVIVDGVTYYSNYNTFDHARAAKQMASTLLGDADFLATLTVEEKNVLNAYVE